MDIAQLKQMKTGQGGTGLLRSRLLCPVDLARLWDRLERMFHVRVLSRLKKHQTMVIYSIGY